MKREMQESRQKQIVAEYIKGTKIRLIEAFFGITRQGIYHILNKYKIGRRGKGLTTNK
jgi:transposase